MISSADFNFRIWIHPDGDSSDIELFYIGFEPNLAIGDRSVTEWLKESFADSNFHEMFGLDETKRYQVVGTAKLLGRYDCCGEYTEDIHVYCFSKKEM